MAARAKKKILAKRFAHAISARVHYRDLEHAYVTEFDCVALLAMLQILLVYTTQVKSAFSRALIG